MKTPDSLKPKCHYCKAALDTVTAATSLDSFGLLLCKACQKSYVARLRKPTKQEVILFLALRSKGISSRLHVSDGFKIIDILIAEAKLHIEVDGEQHNRSPKQALTDLKRTYYSLIQGYITLRIPNSLIEASIEEAVNYIDQFITVRRTQLSKKN